MLAQKAKLFLNIIALFALISFSTSLNAQDKKSVQAEDDLAAQLSTQLTLNQEQIAEVRTILADYEANVTAEGVKVDTKTTAQTEADAAITAVLDESQAALYSDIKEDWWIDVNNSLTAVPEIDDMQKESKEDKY